MAITTLLFDVGGVLLSNGWDTPTRQRAAQAYNLDPEEFEARHAMLKDGFETGRYSLEHYVSRAVFHKPRSYTPANFCRWMFDQSSLLGETLEFVGELARTGRHRLFTLNNESRELHEHRVERFGLADVFDGFLCSCYLGLTKPDEAIYRNALGIVRCKPEEAIFIDDRALNVEAAEAEGLVAHQFTGLDDLRRFLADRGVSA